MKTLYKYASGLVLTGMLCVGMTSNVCAQRGGFHGGGGGVGVSSSRGGGGFSGGSIGFANGGNRVGVRGSTGVGINARGVAAYRSGAGYFGGTGYHGGAFYRSGFGYYSYPHLGFYLDVLPFGYYPFYWGSSLYYYYGGVFYRPYDDGGYEVTAPPIGAGIPSLPENSQGIKIDGAQYYESDGVYYKESIDDKGKKIYVVAGKDGVLNTDASVTDPNAEIAVPKVGDIINQLPDGCRKVMLNGKKYFVSPNDIYYEKVTDPSGNVAYRIASLPASNEDKGI